jgi:hypothetical protein
MRRALLPILLFAVSTPAVAQVGEAPATPETPHIIVTPGSPDPFAMPEQPPLDMNLVSELFPTGQPNLLTPDSIAQKYKLPAIVPDPNAKQNLPTAINYTDGPMKFDLGTKVTTATTTTTIVPPALPDRNKLSGATGGTGEIKGGISYVGEQWELYGRQSLGVGHTDGVGGSMTEATTFGSLYKLPDSMVNGKIGASIELNAANERKTRIEYRQNFGPAEGFIAAEQTVRPTEPEPKPAVRTGVSRKF